MKAARLLLAACCALAAAPAFRLQTLNPSPAEILNLARPLLPAEIANVLAAARAAVAGKTCRLSYVPNGPGPEVLMGPNGRPRFMRGVSGYLANGGAVDANGNRGNPANGRVEVTTFTDYTGRPALKCDGTPLGAELVVEYERRSIDNGWSVKARSRTSSEVAAPLFDMLAGATPVESGDRRSFDDRVGRALVAPWTLPAGAQSGGPVPAGVRQSLWIDTVSLLPLRWSLSVPAAPGTPAIPDYGLSFTYDAALDLRPPDGVAPADCVR